MFSGIIKSHIKVNKITDLSNGRRLTIPIPAGWKMTDGDSIALDGVCTTVEKLKSGNFTVYLMPETLDKTTLGLIGEDHKLNLEMPLRLNDLVGGHLVSGHVDTVATVTKVIDETDSRRLHFKIAKAHTKYIIYKGSITVNGVSLTVVSVDESTFSVSLIPYTLEHTNLGKLEVGSKVNIEIDLVAKYLEKLGK